MTAHTRLKVSGLMIVVSAVFAVLAVSDPGVATAVSSIYIAILLTGFVLTQLWKRP